MSCIFPVSYSIGSSASWVWIEYLGNENRRRKLNEVQRTKGEEKTTTTLTHTHARKRKTKGEENLMTHFRSSQFLVSLGLISWIEIEHEQSRTSERSGTIKENIYNIVYCMIFERQTQWKRTTAGWTEQDAYKTNKSEYIRYQSFIFLLAWWCKTQPKKIYSS